MKFKIIIPARLKSSRFPSKPLKFIKNIPMIIRVCKICARAVGERNTYVATDSKKIFNLVKSHHFQSIMTPSKIPTGTDRVAYASKKIKGKYFINVQGDEPLINHKDILKVISYKKKFKNNVICCYAEILKKENPINTNIPKIIFNKKKELIYISRSLIPGQKNNKKIKYFKQVCIYAFNKKELKVFASFKKKTPIESLEDIELLRFFETKIKVKLLKVKSGSIAVDVPGDIIKVENILRNKKIH